MIASGRATAGPGGIRTRGRSPTRTACWAVDECHASMSCPYLLCGRASQKTAARIISSEVPARERRCSRPNRCRRFEIEISPATAKPNIAIDDGSGMTLATPSPLRRLTHDVLTLIRTDDRKKLWLTFRLPPRTPRLRLDADRQTHEYAADKPQLTGRWIFHGEPSDSARRGNGLAIRANSKYKVPDPSDRRFCRLRVTAFQPRSRP